jgi:hypothetical protein
MSKGMSDFNVLRKKPTDFPSETDASAAIAEALFPKNRGLA